MTLTGATMFARYAYPPNVLGYCGPDDASPLLSRDPTPRCASLATLASSREPGPTSS